MADTETSAGDLRLPDRPAALAALERLLLESWRGFDHAREGQPPLSEDLRERLGRPLPSEGMDAVEGLEIAGAVLDASIAQPRPRFLAYVGSSGLEIGVLGDALMACHDVNVAVSSGGADLLERDTDTQGEQHGARDALHPVRDARPHDGLIRTADRDREGRVPDEVEGDDERRHRHRRRQDARAVAHELGEQRDEEDGELRVGERGSARRPGSHAQRSADDHRRAPPGVSVTTIATGTNAQSMS